MGEELRLAQPCRIQPAPCPVGTRTATNFTTRPKAVGDTSLM